MNDPVACLRLARTQGVGPTVYRRLLARFGSAEEALRVLPDLARKAGRETPPPIPSAGTVAPMRISPLLPAMARWSAPMRQ